MTSHIHSLGAAREARQDAETQATKLTLIALFLGVFGTFSSRLMRRKQGFELRPFDLLLLGLSSFRVGRMLAYEGVAAPLREPFTETTDDSYGAAKTVVAEGTGARRAIGELLSCPICAATWVGAGLVYGLHLCPSPTRAFMAIMGTTGVAHIAYALTEALTWWAQMARKRCGPD
jgi:hypothetical protein